MSTSELISFRTVHSLENNRDLILTSVSIPQSERKFMFDKLLSGSLSKIFLASIFSMFFLKQLPAVAKPNVTATESNRITLIDRVPYTISKPGQYEIKNNLSYTSNRGAAITINSDSVTLDFKKYTLKGTAGSDSSAIGILAVDRKKITVTQGKISGFYFGIDFRASNRDTTKSGKHRISEIVADQNWYFGIRIEGSDSIVEKSSISRTGGSTKKRHTIPHSLRLVGQRNIMRNNCIQDMILKLYPDGKGEVVGVHFDQAKGSLMENNFIQEESNKSDSIRPKEDHKERTFAVWVNGGPKKDTDLTIRNNLIHNFKVPIVFAPGSDGKVNENQFYLCDSKPIRGNITNQLTGNTILKTPKSNNCPENCGISW